MQQTYQVRDECICVMFFLPDRISFIVHSRFQFAVKTLIGRTAVDTKRCRYNTLNGPHKLNFTLTVSYILYYGIACLRLRCFVQ